MPDLRSVTLTRLELGRYLATNARGTTLTIGHGQNNDFTPVELLLVALAGCPSVDIDHLTTRRAEPTSFEVTATGDKIKDDSGGTRLVDLQVTFQITFPEGADGDRAREMLPRAVQQSHQRLCTVSRTIEAATPVTMTLA